MITLPLIRKLDQILRHGIEVDIMEVKMKEEVNVNELIEIFSDMAKRETLLARGGVSQNDLLVQIIGTIVKVAMED